MSARMTPEERGGSLLAALEGAARVERPFGHSREDVLRIIASAIRSAEVAAADRAYKDAEDVLQRFISKQNHRAMTVYDAVVVMIEEMRLRSLRSKEGGK
jgi:hypothetical protein